MFKKDAKSAMAGRLLIRKAIVKQLGVPWNKIILSRTDKGKPCLEHPRATHFSFNISHQGDYVVLASQTNGNVGIDVMKAERPNGIKGLSDFFHTMRRQYTELEWATICSLQNEWDQLAAFYRLWCLKESYIKALGIGIGFELKRMEFQINTLGVPISESICDTKLFLDRCLKPEWIFQETKLDNLHHVAVAVNNMSQEEHSTKSLLKFQELSFAELVESSVPLGPEDVCYWENFNQKPENPSHLS